MENVDLTPPTLSPQPNPTFVFSEPMQELTPPTKEAKPKKERKPRVKKEKVVKEVDPNAPPKVRAAKQDYGYADNAIITINADKPTGYRGSRLEWLGRLKSFEGRTAQEFIAAFSTNPKDPPRGWLAFFCKEEVVVLVRPATPEVTAGQTAA